MLWEIGFECGCKFAIYKNSIEIKICRKHYEKLKKASVEEVLSANLKIAPEDIPKLQELRTRVKTMAIRGLKVDV